MGRGNGECITNIWYLLHFVAWWLHNFGHYTISFAGVLAAFTCYGDILDIFIILDIWLMNDCCWWLHGGVLPFIFGILRIHGLAIPRNQPLEGTLWCRMISGYDVVIVSKQVFPSWCHALCYVFFLLAWYCTMIWYCTVHPLCAISAMFIEEIQGTVSRWFRFCPWETAKCGKSHGRIQGWWCAEESWARLACPVLQTTSDWSSNAGGSEQRNGPSSHKLSAWDFIGQDQPDQSAFFSWNFHGDDPMISGISYPLSTYINIIHFFGWFHEGWDFTIFPWYLMGPMGQFWLVTQGVIMSMVNGT